MPKKSVLGVAVLSTFFATPANAGQTVAPPKPDGLVEQWLSDRLSGVISSCLGNGKQIKMRKKVGKSDIASAVPEDLVRYVKDTGKLNYWAIAPRAAADRQFGYVFSKADVENGAYPNQDKRYLAVDFDTPDAGLLQNGHVDFATISQTCESAFAVAASAGGGLADETLKAAGSAATTGKQNLRADIAYGPFVSPFTSLYDGGTTQQRFYVAMLFWDWRSRNANEDGYLIEQFQGYAMSRSVLTTSATDIDGRASAGLTLPFFSFSSSAKGKYAGRREYKAQRFEVVTTDWLPNRIDRRYKLPSEADLNVFIAQNAKSTVSYSGDNVLIGGLLQTSFVDVPWMPAKFCTNARDYEITGKSAAVMDVVSVEYKEADHNCHFIVTYKPEQSAGTGSLDVPFAIHRRTAGLPATMKGFEIPVRDLQYQWSDIPKLKPNATVYDLDGFDGTLPEGDKLVWRIRGTVQDKNKLSPGDVELTGLGFADGCKPVAGALPKAYGDMQLSNRQAGMIDFLLTVTMSYAKSPGNDLRIAGKASQACKLIGNLGYTINGRSVSRPLSGDIILKLPTESPSSTERGAVAPPG